MSNDYPLIRDNNSLAVPQYQVIPFRINGPRIALLVVSVYKVLSNWLDTKFICHRLTITHDFKLFRAVLTQKADGDSH